MSILSTAMKSGRTEVTYEAANEHNSYICSSCSQGCEERFGSLRKHPGRALWGLGAGGWGLGHFRGGLRDF